MAFDRVNHEKMIECLHNIGTDEKDLRLIVNLYWTQRATIQLERSMSDSFEIKRGVRQGCVLSPCLFNLYTEHIFRHIEDLKGICIGGIQINNLRYADDTVLLAESERDLQAIVDGVNEAGKVYSMKMNAKKTKTMVISREEQTPKLNITIDGSNIEQVSNFVYLGHKLTEDGRCEEEIKRRIGIAKTTFCKMNRVLTSRSIPLTTRIRILHCYVWSTLMYGAEVWTITPQMSKRLTAFEMWTYRRMLRISWKKKVTNLEVLERVNHRKRLFRTIQTKKLQYFAHITCHSPLQRTLLEGKINGKRGRGRPRTSWASNITCWTGLNYINATRKALQRSDWRTLASNPLSEDGT